MNSKRDNTLKPPPEEPNSSNVRKSSSPKRPAGDSDESMDNKRLRREGASERAPQASQRAASRAVPSSSRQPSTSGFQEYDVSDEEPTGPTASKGIKANQRPAEHERNPGSTVSHDDKKKNVRKSSSPKRPAGDSDESTDNKRLRREGASTSGQALQEPVDNKKSRRTSGHFSVNDLYGKQQQHLQNVKDLLQEMQYFLDNPQCPELVNRRFVSDLLKLCRDVRAKVSPRRPRSEEPLEYEDVGSASSGNESINSVEDVGYSWMFANNVVAFLQPTMESAAQTLHTLRQQPSGEGTPASANFGLREFLDIVGTQFFELLAAAKQQEQNRRISRPSGDFRVNHLLGMHVQHLQNVEALLNQMRFFVAHPQCAEFENQLFVSDALDSCRAIHKRVFHWEPAEDSARVLRSERSRIYEHVRLGNFSEIRKDRSLLGRRDSLPLMTACSKDYERVADESGGSERTQRTGGSSSQPSTSGPNEPAEHAEGSEGIGRSSRTDTSRQPRTSRSRESNWLAQTRMFGGRRAAARRQILSRIDPFGIASGSVPSSSSQPSTSGIVYRRPSSGRSGRSTGMPPRTSGQRFNDPSEGSSSSSTSTRKVTRSAAREVDQKQQEQKRQLAVEHVLGDLLPQETLRTHRYPEEQTDILIAEYERNQSPDNAVYARLAKQLGWKPGKVRKWFTNRRNQEKRKQEEERRKSH